MIKMLMREEQLAIGFYVNPNEDQYETEFMNKINVPFFRTNKSITEPQLNLMELFSVI